ncbi:MAG: 50S ribosomal protein L29 [Mollicutes bacterium PWAP]|nr:50S ribosomal protein L29 [Mollicutes bacterium PWAP]
MAKSLDKMSISELKETVQELKAQLFTLKFQNSTGQLDNTHKISILKKDIARVLTELRIQEMNEGANNEKQKTINR